METLPQSQIVKLAAIISTNTALYDEYVSSHGLPYPSFEKDAPIQLELPDEILQARETVLGASLELHDLMLGPLGLMQNQLYGHTNLIGIHAIYRFGIATSFPVDEEASYEQISRVCGLNEPDLRRVMRHAMTRHVFKEPRAGFVAHTAISKALAQMPIMRDWIGAVCEEMWPSATRTVDALVKWPGSQEPNHTGFVIAHNTEEGIFDELAKHPARSARFANAMSMNSAGEGFEPSHLIEAYPWETMGTKVVVDVGGSNGTFAIALAQHVKSLHCIIQDLPEVVDGGASRIPPELAGRVTFMAHSFLHEQPVKNADVYYFRWIFHDWSDKYCIKILQSLIPALKPGARIIISDITLPPPGILPANQEWFFRGMDLTMLEIFNSKERHADEWGSLFERADARFKLISIKKPVKSRLSFIEVCWMGENVS